MSDTNSFSATRARKRMWRFFLNDCVREIRCACVLIIAPMAVTWPKQLKPAVHHAPATARAPRVCTLVPFIVHEVAFALLGM